METRVKWIESPQIDSGAMKNLAREIQGRIFSQNVSRGFLPDAIRRPRFITGKFIERIEGTRLVADPFGSSLELPFVTFETVTFRISSEFPHFEILDAPRSLNRFTNFLSEISGVRFSLSPVSADPMLWAENLSQTWGEMTVSELRSDNLTITPSLSADITLSGSCDILVAARKYFSPRPLVVSIINATFGEGARQIRATLSNLGSCKVTLEPQDQRFADLRTALQQSKQSRT